MNVENELDIRGLFRALWAGKSWIAGIAVLFALIVLVYTFLLMRWSATAITDRPTVNMLGGYYSQQQFLRNLDIKANLVSVDQPSVMDEAYKVHHAAGVMGYPAATSGCKRTTTSSASRVTLAPMPPCWMT